MIPKPGVAAVPVKLMIPTVKGDEKTLGDNARRPHLGDSNLRGAAERSGGTRVTTEIEEHLGQLFGRHHDARRSSGGPERMSMKRSDHRKDPEGSCLTPQGRKRSVREGLVKKHVGVPKGVFHLLVRHRLELRELDGLARFADQGNSLSDEGRSLSPWVRRRMKHTQGTPIVAVDSQRLPNDREPNGVVARKRLTQEMCVGRECYHEARCVLESSDPPSRPPFTMQGARSRRRICRIDEHRIDRCRAGI